MPSFRFRVERLSLMLLLVAASLHAVQTPPPPLQTNEVAQPIQIAVPAPLKAPVVPFPTSTPATSAPPAALPASAVQGPAVQPAVPTPAFGSTDPGWPTNRLRGPIMPLRDFVSHFGGGELRRISENPTATYELQSGRGKVLLRVGSTRATVMGVDVTLSQVPQFLGGELCLHRLDMQNTLHPLLWGDAPPSAPSSGCIWIDAGHGGKDVGTTSVDGRHHEKNLTLDWALRLRALLEAEGFQVRMSRTNDIEVPLAQRVLMAEEAKAAVFVSLHLNAAAPKSGRRGLECYALTPPGMVSTVVRDSEDNARLSFPNNRHDAVNLLLAWRIQMSVTRTAGAPDRGVQRARFMGVLRGQNRPAVLVEGGYLSHPEEARRLGDPRYRQKLAEGVAEALRAWMNPKT